MKSTLKASVASFDRPSGNNHQSKKYDDNIMLLRDVRHKQELNSDQYYARMIVDPNGGIFDEKGLEKTAGLVTISKCFHAIHLPISSYKTYMVQVKDPNKCWLAT